VFASNTHLDNQNSPRFAFVGCFNVPNSRGTTYRALISDRTFASRYRDARAFSNRFPTQVLFVLVLFCPYNE
jgi:hypothetical protein